MPPEDTIFTSDGDGEAAPAKPATEATQATPTSSLTAEQVSKMLDERMEGVNSSLSQITQVFQSIQQQAEAQGQRMPKNGDGQDWNERFYNDPKGTISQEFSEAAFPLVQKQADAMADLLVAQHKSSVDSEFGEGTWDSEFEPDLRPIFDRVKRDDPVRLLDKTAVSNAINTLKGIKFARLVELREKAKSTRQQGETLEQRIAKLESGNLTGGIRSVRQPAEKLTEEHSEYIESRLRETGTRPDEKRLIAMMGTGGTFEDWMKANKASKGGE